MSQTLAFSRTTRCALVLQRNRQMNKLCYLIKQHVYMKWGLKGMWLIKLASFLTHFAIIWHDIWLYVEYMLPNVI